MQIVISFENAIKHLYLCVLERSNHECQNALGMSTDLEKARPNAKELLTPRDASFVCACGTGNYLLLCKVPS